MSINLMNDIINLLYISINHIIILIKIKYRFSKYYVPFSLLRATIYKNMSVKS
jgi:hypothetical protein